MEEVILKIPAFFIFQMREKTRKIYISIMNLNFPYLFCTRFPRSEAIKRAANYYKFFSVILYSVFLYTLLTVPCNGVVCSVNKFWSNSNNCEGKVNFSSTFLLVKKDPNSSLSCPNVSNLKSGTVESSIFLGS